MLARFAAVRRVPRLLVVPVRYSSGEGSLAQSKEFGYVLLTLCLFDSLTLNNRKKERAHEGWA
jgi:hypothetical protein